MDTNETKVYLALLIAVAILAAFLIFFITTIIYHQRRNQKLHNEQVNAEIRTLEKDRKRIASDLHDDLGPMLSAVKLLMNDLELNLPDDQVTREKANKYIDGVLLQLRRISNDLMPQALTTKGLVAAVDEYVRELNQKRKMHVGFHASRELIVDPAQGLHLYRIIHEVIHNADKHAGASSLDIHLNRENDKLILLMKDNGHGFDTRDMWVVQKGLGLKNITSRVDALKGNIYLNSAPDIGTSYTIEIPSQLTI